jgi:hypothetical protein
VWCGGVVRYGVVRCTCAPTYACTYAVTGKSHEFDAATHSWGHSSSSLPHAQRRAGLVAVIPAEAGVRSSEACGSAREAADGMMSSEVSD